MNYFQDSVRRKIYHPDNGLEEEALWYSLSGIIQDDLDFVEEQWNTERIRKSSHNTVRGQPQELFHHPELHGGMDGLSLDVKTNELLGFDDAESTLIMLCLWLTWIHQQAGVMLKNLYKFLNFS